MPRGTCQHGSHRRSRSLAALLLGCLVAASGSAAGIGAVPSSSLQDLHWRLVGPFRGGWATAVTGIPGNASTFYFGAADGGVWKTDDAGSTWRPLFDQPVGERPGSSSIGALAVAPSDPRVLWVGTGQIHQRWDIVSGDGVYRSTDDGESWQQLGLTETRHIGALWVDPRDADTALVAALGHVFGPNEERGVYRTEDGGASWAKVLYRDADTGAADIAGDPTLPDLLYASLWEVRRYPWLDYFQPTVGAGSGIYKSIDGGRSWTQCGEAGRAGLPDGPLGRIELAVASGTRGQRVWAAIETSDSAGLWRSEDGGASWAQVNDDDSIGGSYMAWLRADPADPDTVWTGGQPLRRSTDGGATFTIVRSSPGGDDYHDLWIDPTAPRRMITGADQGAVISWNGGASWSGWYNQPTGQFYRLAVDNRFPYRIYSGQQDSGTVGIASRSDYGQITFRDWSPVGGDERDGDVPFPADPDIVFGAGLGGRLSKWDARTGQVQNVSPWPVGSYAARPGTTRYRYDWITPVAISRRPPHPIYQGAQVLFRSVDQGASWDEVSPDLTGAVADEPDCDGDVPRSRATACGYGVIFAIAPSPIADELVWVGTTNGRVQLTRDDGGHWFDVTPPGLPDWSKVNIIDASPTDPATATVAADRHRVDETRPLVFRTHDYGATWSEIGAGLPAGEWVGAVRQDAVQAKLLFAGTNRGVYVSFDDGGHWQSLQLDLPTTGINDLLVHDDDVIVATQGRAIWVLDDVSLLRHLASDPKPVGGVLLAAPARAWRLRFNQNKDTPLPPEEPRGENPPVGAVIDYVLGDSVDGPVIVEIVDPSGQAIREFRSDEDVVTPNARIYFADAWLGEAQRPGAGPGHHRFVWDLRLPAPATLSSSYAIAAVPGKTPVFPAGAFVLPGRYEVRISAAGASVTQPLDVAMDPRVTVDRSALETLLDFQGQVGEVLGQAVVLAADGNEEAAATGKRLAGWLTSLATDLESADAAPTEPQRELLAACEDELGSAGG